MMSAGAAPAGRPRPAGDIDLRDSRDDERGPRPSAVSSAVPGSPSTLHGPCFHMTGFSTDSGRTGPSGYERSQQERATRRTARVWPSVRAVPWRARRNRGVLSPASVEGRHERRGVAIARRNRGVVSLESGLPEFRHELSVKIMKRLDRCHTPVQYCRHADRSRPTGRGRSEGDAGHRRRRGGDG